jgi:putative transposase
VRKHYQNKKIDTNQSAVPETVSVALAELVGEVHEGLLALAVGAGLQVMAAVIARCQLHKLRNVQDRLPQKLRSMVAKRMRAAYHAQTALDAQAELQTLAGELERSHPGAAASLHEGLAETLTVLRLGVPPTLARTLRSTNCVESMIEICRDHSRNVKHWQDETMALRWCAAGMVEAGKQFRRVNGHLHLRALRTALERHVAAENARANKHNHTSKYGGVL